MNVYAEYIEENELSFRTNTILQFGDSWNLIGNIVLANPGSATPIEKINDKETLDLKEFYRIYKNEIEFKKNNWHRFADDATMRFIEKIFSGYYINKNKNLNGVIQLFNTFNIRNQNLEEAVQQIGIESDVLFSYGVEKFFHKKPTYFGFSGEVINNNILNKVAKNIFENSDESIKNMYKQSFEDNAFYHPMYINRAHNQDHFQWYKKEVLEKLLD